MKSECRRYVQTVIAAYIALPHTPNHARRADRQLAAELYARGIPLSLINAAFLLGTARRLRRSPPPVRRTDDRPSSSTRRAS